MIRSFLLAVSILLSSASPLVMSPLTRHVSHWDYASYRSGQRVACAMFATEVANGELAPEAAFDPLAPCARMGFVYGGRGWVKDCGSAAGIFWPRIPMPNNLPRCKRR